MIRPILQLVSLLALIALTLPSVMFLAGRTDLETVKWIMLVASIVWFIAATPWMWREAREQEPEKDEVVIP